MDEPEEQHLGSLTRARGFHPRPAQPLYPAARSESATADSGHRAEGPASPYYGEEFDTSRGY